MSRTCWLLAESIDGFRLANPADDQGVDVGLPPETNPEEAAIQVRRALEERGYAGEPVVLALMSTTCLAATFSHAGRSVARNPQAMAYALEECLPLAAEDTVCDFVAFDHDALGVAVQVAALRPLLSALELGGVQIISVVPLVLAALQQQVGGARHKGRRLVWWQDGDRVELIELIDGRPHLWRSLPAAADALRREMRMVKSAGTAGKPDEFAAWDLRQDLRDGLAAEAGKTPLAEAVEQVSICRAAVRAAVAISDGSFEPWIELRRGALGKHDPYRPIRNRLGMLAIAAACLVAALSITTWIRASSYASLADGFQREQEHAFRQVFPGIAVPLGIRSRLESEHRKLAGVTGQLTGLPRLEAAIVPLRDALCALPEDLRYRFLEIRIAENRVDLDGEVRRHGDADLLAAALRKAGFEVESPRTEALATAGIAVTLHATRSSGESLGKKGPSANTGAGP